MVDREPYRNVPGAVLRVRHCEFWRCHLVQKVTQALTYGACSACVCRRQVRRSVAGADRGGAGANPNLILADDPERFPQRSSFTLFNGTSSLLRTSLGAL